MCLSSLLLIISKDIREKGCYTTSLCAFTWNKLLATWFRSLSPLDFFFFLSKWCTFAEPQILQDLQKILFSVIVRSPPFLGSIFCLNWITVTIRKICPNNSFFTQLLSFVFLPSAVLQSNYQQNLIEQCMIYEKMLVVFSAFIFYFLNLQQHYKTLSSSVIRHKFFDRHHHCVGVPELPLHRAAGSHLRAVCLPLIPHWPHPPNTGMCLKCSQTTASITMCITRNI